MYYLFILAVAAERLVELVVSRRNTRWSMAHGGREFGRGHYPVMVAMHAAAGVVCGRGLGWHRPFIAWLGWPMVAVVVISTVVRWWCVATLGKHWNPRLIVIPNAPLVQGPIPVDPPPQLHRRDRRGGRAATGALGVGDGHCLQRGQRAGAHRADPHRKHRARLPRCHAVTGRMTPTGSIVLRHRRPAPAGRRSPGCRARRPG